jgi:hypothetical protein
MGIIHHQPGTVALLDLDEAGEVRPIAIHGEKALGHNHAARETRALGREQRVERIEIVMREIAPRRPGELRADHDAIVDQRIMNEQILRAEEGRNRGNPARMSRIEGDAIFGIIGFRKPDLEVAMRLALAGADAAC